MEAAAAVAIVRLAHAHEVPVWIIGGWGVDALIGTQTRVHDDLDLIVDTCGFDRFIDLLMVGGFEIEINWMPVRLRLTRVDGACVDLRPASFGARGCGVHEGFDGVRYLLPRRELVSGRIEGHEVPCVSAGLQLGFHLGYEPTDQDRADMAALADSTGVDLCAPYA